MLSKDDLTREFEVDGEKLVAEVSPCSWMYPNYGLQVGVRLVATGGQAYALNKSVPYARATAADIDSLLGTFRLARCSRCGGPRFADREHQRNRGDLCETCFVGDLRAELRREQEKEARKVAARDKRMKAKGHTHRVTAWIHPADGGDDRQVDIYVTGEPTKREVQALLRGQGGAVADDYAVVAL